jgi:Zn-dependent peptidase ImmA (M78 family)
MHWDGKLPVDPTELAKRLGADVVAIDGNSANGLSGKLDVCNGKSTISYNRDEMSLRQRFTIAHELGHLVLNHGPSFRDPAQNYSLYNYDPDEVDANKFAAELLMPEEAINILIEKHGISNIGELSRRFMVSQQAMEFRLKNLGWL